MSGDNTQHFILDDWPRMTDAARIKAHRLAERNLKARYPKPERTNYTETTIHEFDDRFRSTVWRGVWLALFAGFVVSSVRLFAMGAVTFNHTMLRYESLPSGVRLLLSIAVGICMVILAETGQVIFSLAFAMDRENRKPLWFGLIASTLIALIGNIQGALWPMRGITAFGILEAIVPPVLVMSLAYVLKNHAIEDARMRNANERAYQEAMALWAEEFKELESHPGWQHVFIHALRDTYARTYNKRVAAAKLQDEDWVEIVSRELHFAGWAEQVMNAKPARARHSGLNSAGIQVNSAKTAKDRVIEYLHDNPGMAELLKSNELPQAQIAADLGVSQASISRGLAAFSQNGHSKVNTA